MCKTDRKLFTSGILLLCWGRLIYCLKENITGKSDFAMEKFITRIAFGSCMNGMFTGSKWHKKPQVVWKQIMEHEPDLWIWLGDAAYADTRILPLVWKPSPLALMAKYFRRQKEHPDYQEFLKSGVTVLGIWDDHDYGMNDGGKHFKSRLRSQDIYLDFIDEPLDSLRRRREGLYASYTFGHGDKAVKLILLDVRSFAVHGKDCDILGGEQWKWLTEQLSDPTPVAFTIVASGIQILSNAPVLENWNCCPQSFDRLIWLTQKREKVIFLSGDVHFGEFSCSNSFSSGYPMYEMTSSGLWVACTVGFVNDEACDLFVRSILHNEFRIFNPVMERNFGFIDIDWNSTSVQLKLQVFGEHNVVMSELLISLDHIQRRWNAEQCPQFKGLKPDSIKLYKFWTLLALVFMAILGIALTLLFFLYKTSMMVIRILVRCIPWKPNQGLKVKEKKS